MKTEIKTETLNKTINKIKELGYQVFVPNDDKPKTYAYYSNGNDIGYIQINRFYNSIEISTVHKANLQTGTGYSIFEGENSIGVEHILQEHLEAGFIVAPAWARGERPEKYTLDEWLTQKQYNQNLIEV